MPRLRRFNYMCSSTVSGTAYRFRHGSTLCSPTVEKILCRSFIVSVLKISPCFLRERGDSQEGGNRRCLPSCAPARRQRTFPRSAERNSPLNLSEKDCRPDRVNRVRGSSAPEGRCRKQKNSTLFRVLLRITNAYAFLINASRRSRPLSISVSEVA